MSPLSVMRGAWGAVVSLQGPLSVSAPSPQAAGGAVGPASTPRAQLLLILSPGQRALSLQLRGASRKQSSGDMSMTT